MLPPPTSTQGGAAREQEIQPADSSLGQSTGKRAGLWVESLVVAAAEIAVAAGGAWLTSAVAVQARRVVIGHGLSRLAAEAVSRQG